MPGSIITDELELAGAFKACSAEVISVNKLYHSLKWTLLTMDIMEGGSS
jgi:hypothetical protein